AQIEAAELRKTLEAEKNAAEEKIAIIQNAREELSNQFKALANEILEQKSKTFTEQNQANLTTLLHPLREKFGEFQQKVESLEKEGISGRTELKTQIEQLRTLNERLSADAANLVTALKGSSKTQGDWGELVLEKLLESAGLRRNVEYRVQSTMGREEGGNARLDVILDLPDDRHLVIDSKVSLNSYTDYCNTENEEERKQALRSHLHSVRAHLKELSAREYQNLYGLESLDFVLMFVPVEPAFMLAIASDNRLWQDAYEKNVMLVSPSSLLCVVRTVAQIWRQERQARNVREISDRGRILYDKFVGFTDDLQRIGRKLGEAKEAYEGAYNKLTRADGNLVSQAQKLVKLGIRPNKTLPQPLLDQALEAEESFELAAGSDDESGPPH
ncbi:MAG: DNA recombination protein RmuC, partial [Acidobacteriaceae bacterium]